MTDPLNINRFRELADAYGADISRWPPEERAPAMRLAAEPEASRILATAMRLDALLDGWTVAPPSAGLMHRISREGLQLQVGWGRRLKVWWAGIGIVAALSGAVAGSLGAASIFANDTQAYSATVFGDIPDMEDQSE